MVSGIAATGLAATLAGCSSSGGDSTTGDGDDSSGDGSDGDDSDMDSTDTDGSMDDSTTTDGGSGGDMESPTFDYTFSDSDDSVGSSLTGLSVDYPDGSGAVSDASIAEVTLGGSDVSGDVDGTSSSNNGTTFTVDFGGNNAIEAGDQLVLALSGVDEPSGSYEATATVNPQSGGTEFTESF